MLSVAPLLAAAYLKASSYLPIICRFQFVVAGTVVASAAAVFAAVVAEKQVTLQAAMSQNTDHDHPKSALATQDVALTLVTGNAQLSLLSVDERLSCWR